MVTEINYEFKSGGSGSRNSALRAGDSATYKLNNGLPQYVTNLLQERIRTDGQESGIMTWIFFLKGFTI